jgi:hypothetical protein
VLRLLIAILLSVAHIALLHTAEPYRQASTGAVAVGTSITLQCTLQLALIIRVHDSAVVQNMDVYSLAYTMLAFNVCVVVAIVALVAYEHRTASRRTATLRVLATGEPPVLSLAMGKVWHLFLSHS